MKIEIEIPKEFEEHFKKDKFEDSLHRLCADAHLIAGNYEQETAIMLIKAFKESKPAYDTERVIEQLNDLPTHKEVATSEKHPFCAYETEMISKHKVMRIVKKGGVE